MRIIVDDWHFVPPPDDGSVVAVDLFLDNGQHARLEVIPLINPYSEAEQIPELVVKCEMPGEKLHMETPTRRWITRPPDRCCEWSHVELSPTLIRQINDRLSPETDTATA
jgi:hypothetical protein